jgi:hypothetical protein
MPVGLVAMDTQLRVACVPLIAQGRADAGVTCHHVLDAASKTRPGTSMCSSHSISSGTLVGVRMVARATKEQLNAADGVDVC